MNFQSLLNGLNVYVSPDRPKMVLSEDIPLDPKFRQEYNEWLLSFFGTTNMLKDGEIINGTFGVFLNPRTYAHLKARLSAEQ